jgi:ABC-2 type transport system ATP-binding protein
MIPKDALCIADMEYQVAGRVLLSLPNLELPRRGLYLVMGQNGSGKSLLLHLLSGRLLPSRGSVTLHADTQSYPLSRDVSTRHALRLMADHFVGQEGIRAREYLHQQSLIYHRFDKEAARQDLEQVIAYTDLGSLQGQLVERLSFGECRRLSLAAALLASPQYLFLDEPLTGLDAYQQEQMSARLRKQASQSMVVLSSHALLAGAPDYHILWVREHRVYEFSPLANSAMLQQMLGELQEGGLGDNDA